MTNTYRWPWRRPFRSARIVHITVLGGFLLLLVRPVWAQEGEQPVLPDLAPREVEIRGELIIRFPLLERQPLIGFNPPPRIPIIPADRRPLVEEYKQERADLPQTSVTRPAPPPGIASGLGPIYGEVETSGGTYFSRVVRSRIGGPLGGSVRALTYFDYQGSDGSEVLDAVPGLKNPSDSFDGRVKIISEKRSVSVAISGEGHYDSFSLFGRAPDLAQIADVPERTGRGGRATLSFETASDRRTNVSGRLTAGASRWETESPAASSVNDDRRGEAALRLEVPTSAFDLWTDGSGGIASLKGDSYDSHSQVHYYGAVGIARDGRRLSVSIGLRMLGTEFDISATEPAPKRRIAYLSPDFDVTASISNRVRLFVENRPSVDAGGLSAVYQDNPFVSFGPSFEPVVRYADGRAGLTMDGGRLQMVVYGDYERAANGQYFSNEGTSDAGFFEVRHAASETWRIGADIALSITGRFHAATGFAYQSADLVDTGASMPYEPDYQVHGGLSYRFGRPRALLQLQGRYESARFVDETETGDIGDLVDLNFTGTIDVSRHIGLTLRALNLTRDSLVRWQGYPDSSVRILGGVRILW